MRKDGSRSWWAFHCQAVSLDLFAGNRFKRGSGGHFQKLPFEGSVTGKLEGLQDQRILSLRMRGDQA